jgi:hypothetical protein
MWHCYENEIFQIFWLSLVRNVKPFIAVRGSSTFDYNLQFKSVEEKICHLILIHMLQLCMVATPDG